MLIGARRQVLTQVETGLDGQWHRPGHVPFPFSHANGPAPLPYDHVSPVQRHHLRHPQPAIKKKVNDRNGPQVSGAFHFAQDPIPLSAPEGFRGDGSGLPGLGPTDVSYNMRSVKVYFSRKTIDD